MDISKLDEYQGLEAQMVRDWLTARKAYRLDGFWRHPQEQKYCYTDGEYGGLLWSDTLHKLTVDFGLASVQALLREINPRMRKGMPSQAAREAHGFKGGMWVGSRGEAGSGGTLVFVSFDDSSSGLPLTVWDFSEFDTWEVGQSEIDNEWLFWPADEHGNKTRWPTDAEGKML